MQAVLKLYNCFVSTSVPPPTPQPHLQPSQHPPQADQFQYCALQPCYGNPSGVQFSPGKARDPWNFNPRSYPHYSQTYSVTNDLNNISVCIGCKNCYPKNAQPTDDLCIRHQDGGSFHHLHVRPHNPSFPMFTIIACHSVLTTLFLLS